MPLQHQKEHILLPRHFCQKILNLYRSEVPDAEIMTERSRLIDETRTLSQFLIMQRSLQMLEYTRFSALPHNPSFQINRPYTLCCVKCSKVEKTPNCPALPSSLSLEQTRCFMRYSHSSRLHSCTKPATVEIRITCPEALSFSDHRHCISRGQNVC